MSLLWKLENLNTRHKFPKTSHSNVITAKMSLILGSGKSEKLAAPVGKIGGSRSCPCHRCVKLGIPRRTARGPNVAAMRGVICAHEAASARARACASVERWGSLLDVQRWK